MTLIGEGRYDLLPKYCPQAAWTVSVEGGRRHVAVGVKGEPRPRMHPGAVHLGGPGFQREGKSMSKQLTSLRAFNVRSRNFREFSGVS